MNLVPKLEHTFWADDQYIEYVSAISLEQFEEILPGFDKSIKDLIYHLDEVYWFWFHFLTDQDYSDEPDSDRSREDMLSSIKEQHNNLLKLSSDTSSYKSITIQWDEKDTPVISSTENILFNFLTHSAYHRGQIAVLLRHMGFDKIEDTDFNPYFYNLHQRS